MDVIAKSKLIVFPLCLLPLAALGYEVVYNQLGPDPARGLTLELGEWALRFLLLSLAMTPLRMLTGVGKLIRFRRMLGLFALFYAVLHLSSYLAFMLGGDWLTLLEDLSKRPYIVVGALAVLILLMLGGTSTKGMVRRLGKNWAKLHKLAYLAGGLAILHYLWLVKSDYSEPLVYGAIFLGLMLFRLPVVRRKMAS